MQVDNVVILMRFEKSDLHEAKQIICQTKTLDNRHSKINLSNEVQRFGMKWNFFSFSDDLSSNMVNSCDLGSQFSRINSHLVLQSVGLNQFHKTDGIT